jgi:tetratricopeptide (TPR) repeat protein
VAGNPENLVPEQIIYIDSRKALPRVSAIALIVLSLVWSVFLVRWYLGNTLAEYFNPDANGAEMARLAVSLAPNDPLTRWRLGDFTEKRLPPDQIAEAVSEYEKAASLSPNDYRFWMAFGRALEQAGDNTRAEKALRRAVELAPSYSYPRWYLGNLLLRSQRYQEAFAELQRASEADPDLRPQLFNLAWEVYKDDAESLKTAAGSTATARAQFSQYVIGRGRVEDGLKLWSALADAEKRSNLATAHAIIANLVGSFRYHQALAVWNDIAPEQTSRATIGEILDGGFETGMAHGPNSIFGWQVQSQRQAQIGIDPNQAHTGNRSLRIVFQVRSNLEPLNLSQLIPVAPNTEYVFECYLKTQKLESAGPPVLTIVNPVDGGTLASSPSAPTGDNDWQRVELSFKTGPTSEAITLKIGRGSCGDNTVCPMFGTIWYDDFYLKPRS